jgi:hypothetical protein
MSSTRDESSSKPLPSFNMAGLTLGTFIAGLEQKILHNHPPAPIVAEEHERSGARTLNGLTIEMSEPLDHPEPPDTTGARL